MTTGIDPVVYGANGSGGHNVAVRVNGLNVLITSNGPEHDAACVALAEAIGYTGELAARIERIEREHAEQVEGLREIIQRLRSERDGTREALRCAVEGRRRFFGPVLCVPARDGDWTGPVWLLDPEKQDRGHGLMFASLAEVREMHPELWIVGVTERGVLLDAVRLRVESDDGGAA